MINLGKITSIKGLRGEMKLYVYREYTDLEFIKAAVFIVENKEYILNSYRNYKNNFILSFKDHLDINLIENLVGCEVFVRESSIRNREKYYRYQLVGYQVFDTEKNDLGKVLEVLNTGFQDIIRVGSSEKNSLIPIVDAFVKKINKKECYVIIELIEGLV